MYPELYQYLLQYKKLPVPGIGTFLLERHPARFDFPNKQVLPPTYTYVLDPVANVPKGGFFKWLGTALGISSMDAVVQFNNFAFDMKKQLEKGHTIDWKGVGQVKKGLGEELRFTAHEILVQEAPVPAIRVLREKAEHTVRVGEDERTAAEMEIFLSKPDEKKSYWWAWALALGLLSVLFSGWYLSEHGLDISGIANSTSLKAGETSAATYKLLP